MKKNIFIITCTAFILILASCKENLDFNKYNADFDAYENQFIERLWKENPEWASYEGYYKYANQLSIPSEENRKKSLDFLETELENLAAWDLEYLDLDNSTDYQLIKTYLEKSKWYLTDLKAWEWNPAQYNIAGTINKILLADYAPLDQRLADIQDLLAATPQYYDAAKSNLQGVSEPHLQLAIQQNKGAIDILSNNLQDSITSLPNVESFAKLKTDRDSALAAVKDYIAFLESYQFEANNQSEGIAFRDFRIGKTLYEQKFAYDIVSEFSAKEMYDKALSHKDSLHQKMIVISHQIWEKHLPDQEKPKDELLMVKQLINKISERHAKREDFIAAVRTQIPALEKFVKEKDLLTLDDDKPLEVRPTPKYMRGFAGASISAPGPYDKNAPTYYNVSPLDDWSPADAESWLREYNYYILQILNIHEAIPGHYAQLVYSNKAPSLIKSILGNGAMIEGWAVYTELMMLEAGYGDNEPEMWLMYYKWNLRSTCNMIIDYGIQVENWDRDKVVNLLIQEAFQEEAEASKKWKRATLSQVQLTSYFSGFKEIYDFREQKKEIEGDNFKLKEFHEDFLSYGSAPIKYVKEMMLKQAQE